MAATPKAKSSAPPPPTARADRTSTVVTATLILLTGLGVITVFWEPLAALAGGAPATDSAAETRATAVDGGATATPSPSANGAAPPLPGPVDASGNS